VDEGDAFTTAGFDVHAYGHLHAIIHRDIPVIENTGFMIDGSLFHPGDSFTVPQDPVQTLLLPASGPWLKTGEMIDYAREVAPERGYVIHEALFGDVGLMVLDNFLPMCGKDEDAFRRVDVGTTVEI
jgi:hypothetical protein